MPHHNFSVPTYQISHAPPLIQRFAGKCAIATTTVRLERNKLKVKYFNINVKNLEDMRPPPASEATT